MKKTKKPLSLNVSTVRVLTDDETSRAAGGESGIPCSQGLCPNTGIFTICKCITVVNQSCPSCPCISPYPC